MSIASKLFGAAAAGFRNREQYPAYDDPWKSSTCRRF